MDKIQVKIFMNNNVNEFEKEINKWLKKKNQIKILDFKYQSDVYLNSVLILYEGADNGKPRDN